MSHFWKLRPEIIPRHVLSHAPSLSRFQSWTAKRQRNKPKRRLFEGRTVVGAGRSPPDRLCQKDPMCMARRRSSLSRHSCQIPAINANGQLINVSAAAATRTMSEHEAASGRVGGDANRRSPLRHRHSVACRNEEHRNVCQGRGR